MLFRILAETSESLAETRSRLRKIDLLEGCLRLFAADEIETGVGYLIGNLRQGRIGLGPSIVRHALGVGASDAPTLRIGDVDSAFEQIATTTG
jgi:DNA ligase-1